MSNDKNSKNSILELQVILLCSEKIYLVNKRNKYNKNKALFLLSHIVSFKIWLTDRQMKRMLRRNERKNPITHR